MQICSPPASCIPTARWSPLRVCHRGAAPASLPGTSVGGQSLGEMLGAQGPMPSAESPHDLPVGQRGANCGKKNTLKI